MSIIQRKCEFPAQKGIGYPWTSGTVALSSTVQVAIKPDFFSGQQILNYREK
jgi:hypothetical protein